MSICRSEYLDPMLDPDHHSFLGATARGSDLALLVQPARYDIHSVYRPTLLISPKPITPHRLWKPFPPFRLGSRDPYVSCHYPLDLAPPRELRIICGRINPWGSRYASRKCNWSRGWENDTELPMPDPIDPFLKRVEFHAIFPEKIVLNNIEATKKIM